MSLDQHRELAVYHLPHRRASVDLPINEIIELVSENTEPLEILIDELLERYGNKKIEDLLEHILINETDIMQFDGVDDFIEWENEFLDIRNCFSLGSRFFLDPRVAQGGIDCYICCIEDSFGEPTAGVQIQSQDNHLRLYMIYRDDLDKLQRISGPTVQIGSWNEFEIRKKRRLIRFRVNDETLFKVTPSDWDSGFQTLNVGKGFGLKYFEGDMEYLKLCDERDEIIFSNTEFSQEGGDKETNRNPRKIGITFQEKVEARDLGDLLPVLFGRVSTAMRYEL